MSTVDDILAGQLNADMTFAEKVWAFTARIPRGRVATYGDIAHKLDSKAYRAVGGALHRNPLAPRVPCHRVVGGSGQLTGFAGGIAAKRRLLKSEGVAVNTDRVDLARFRCML